MSRLRHLLVLFLAAAPVPAVAETLIAAMSSHRIQITSNYTGDEVTVFGLVERDGRTASRGDPYDIVVTVRGPRRMLVVREKERLGPIWINRGQRRFPESPVVLSVLTNRPIAAIMTEETARRERIGLINAQRLPNAGFDFDTSTTHFRDGMVRILSDKGLYSEEERGVTFLSGTLFSAPIPVPATAPVGSYDVSIVLYSGGVPLARQSTNFEVVKTGIEQGLASAAHDQPLVYGLVTALLSLLFGWLASVIFRRD